MVLDVTSVAPYRRTAVLLIAFSRLTLPSVRLRRRRLCRRVESTRRVHQPSSPLGCPVLCGRDHIPYFTAQFHDRSLFP